MSNNDENPSKVTAQVIDFASAKANKDAMDRDELGHDRPGPSGPAQSADAANDDGGPIYSPHGEQIPVIARGSRRDAKLELSASKTPRYALFPDGVYELPEADTGEPIYICTPLRIDAVFADQNGAGRGRLVSILVDGEWREIPIPNADIQCRPAAVIAKLVDQGLEISSDKKSKHRLQAVLNTWTSDVKLQTVKRMGWADDSYTSFTIGASMIGQANRLPLVSDKRMVSALAMRGNEVDWKTQVGMLCRENPLMILAASLAFSGPLLSPLAIEGGGLHFRGESSCGKSTLLKVATSVWGSERMITKWNATSSGLEAIASTVNDMLLPLDEIGEISANELYDAVYALADGKGRVRAKSDGSLAEQAQWRIALMSTGELSLCEKLSESRRAPKNGQEVRFIDIEADARTFGAFDELHGATSGSAFADRVQAALRHAYGAPGRAFVQHLIEADTLHKVNLRSNVDMWASNWIAQLPSAVDGQIARVATRFAIIGLAGFLATQFGLTGWDRTAAHDAAAQAFRDWYDCRYGDKREAVDAVVTPLQNFLAANINALVDASVPSTGATPIGWRDATYAYLPSQTWVSIFPGIDATKAAKSLVEMQLLKTAEGNRVMCKAPRALKLEGRPRLYKVNIARTAAYKPD